MNEAEVSLESLAEYLRADQEKLSKSFAQAKSMLLEVFEDSRLLVRGPANDGTALRQTKRVESGEVEGVLDIDIDWLIDVKDYFHKRASSLRLNKPSDQEYLSFNMAI